MAEASRMASAQQQALPPQGEVIAGRYKIIEALGKGSMGSVWIAEDTRLQRKVAVKTLAPVFAGSSEMRTRFDREAKSAARLQSPHIVQIHDYGIEGSSPYIVMELVTGSDLHKLVKGRKKLPVAQVANIIVQLCRGLRVAHDAGIVHRDLKPGNLMVEDSGDEQLIKVLDFGVAKVQMAGDDPHATSAGKIVGTAYYMAPEQARARDDVDHRADLWSAAVIAYRLLTGQLPFYGQTVPDTVVKIVTETAASPRGYTPELPASIDTFFQQAFAVDREERFQSARELATAFYSAVSNRPRSISFTGVDTSGLAIEAPPDSFPFSESYPSSASYPMAGPQPYDSSSAVRITGSTAADGAGADASGGFDASGSLQQALLDGHEREDTDVSAGVAPPSGGAEGALAHDEAQPAERGSSLVVLVLLAVVGALGALLVLPRVLGSDAPETGAASGATTTANAKVETTPTATATASAVAPSASASASAAPSASATASASAAIVPKKTKVPVRRKVQPQPTVPDDLLDDRF
jgi:serine/threonine-protein kinase